MRRRFEKPLTRLAVRRASVFTASEAWEERRAANPNPNPNPNPITLTLTLALATVEREEQHDVQRRVETCAGQLAQRARLVVYSGE